MIREADLYPPVCEYFVKMGYDVKGEVLGCDITAMKEDELIIIELKKGLTLGLLAQAVDRQRMGTAVYMAVPRPKRVKVDSDMKKMLHLLRRLELGLIYVTLGEKKSFVEVVLESKAFDNTKSKAHGKKKKARVVKEHTNRKSSLNQGGVTKTKLVTAYRESALAVAHALKQTGTISLADLKNHLDEPKKASGILAKNYYDWFTKVSRGVYSLNEKGELGLAEFSDYIEEFLEKKEK